MKRMTDLRTIFRTLGSLRLAAVLLMGLAVAMGYATFYEQMHGLELTRRAIYDATWFRTILGLIALNTLFALLARFPFHRGQIGLVVTHSAVLIILIGAVITGRFAVRGHVTLREGESTDRFNTETEVLALADAVTGRQAFAVVDVGAPLPIDEPDVDPVTFDGVTLRAKRYLPDAISVERVTNDADRQRLALQVGFAHEGHSHIEWLFPDGPTELGRALVDVRPIDDAARIDEYMQSVMTGGNDEDAVIEVAIGEESYRIPLHENLGEVVPVTDEVSIEIAAYYPHARLDGRQLRSVSDRPVNPIAVVYVQRGDLRSRRLCPATMPDFRHDDETGLQDINVKLTNVEIAVSEADIAIFVGPADRLTAVFAPQGRPATRVDLSMGESVETPWPETVLTVLQRYDHARVEDWIEPAIPIRDRPLPALIVEVTGDGDSDILAVRKHTRRVASVGGKRYLVSYTYRQRDLGFTLKLDDFILGTYPGTRRPRSYASDVTIITPQSEQPLVGRVSMNAPLQFGGYSLFQTSYQMTENAGTFSTLSVVRDPGMWVVFIGYGLATLGMIIVLVTRIRAVRRFAAARQSQSEDRT